MGELSTVADDIASFLSQIDVLDGYKVQTFNTNISDMENCLTNDDCNQYSYCRDVLTNLSGINKGGTLFVHPNDTGGDNEGGTLGGVQHQNYVCSPNQWNDPQKAPVSIKGSDTLYSYCKGRGVYWAPVHEVAHQVHGATDWWDDDFGTKDCGPKDKRQPHNLATITYSCFDAYSDNLGHHTIMGQYENITDCGDCSSTATPQYASLGTSSCYDDATEDAIAHAIYHF